MVAREKDRVEEKQAETVKPVEEKPAEELKGPCKSPQILFFLRFFFFGVASFLSVH